MKTVPTPTPCPDPRAAESLQRPGSPAITVDRAPSRVDPASSVDRAASPSERAAPLAERASQPVDCIASPGATPEAHHPRRRRRRSSIPVPDATWSDRAKTVARWFEVGAADVAAPPERIATVTDVPLPRDGQIVLITGASGAGKSSLLRRMRDREAARQVVDVATVAWRDGLVIDQFGDDVERALWVLGRFGLGEAQSYLRPPAALSDGQRWRLQLACAVHTGARGAPGAAGTLLVADEFCAVLDRLTASVVARALRRAVDATPGLAAVVATSHDDLGPALIPDVVARCDFGRVSITCRASTRQTA